MRKALVLFGTAIIGFTACKDAPEADKAVTTNAQEVTATTGGSTYTVDNSQSTVEWVGTKPTGHHTGTFKIKEGTVTTDGNNVTGGKFTIDVASVEPVDQDAEGNAKLQKHLKSADFFEVEKYPTGTFEITQVTAGAANDALMKDATHTVTGNLMLKDQSKSVSFPAKISVSDAEVVTDANFNIDRTQWGINYQSDKSVQNKFIEHEVNIKLHVVAKK